MNELWWSQKTAESDPGSVKIMLDSQGSAVKCTHHKILDGRKPESDAVLVDNKIEKLTRLADSFGATSAGEAFAAEKGVAPDFDGLMSLVDEARYAAKPAVVAPMTDAQKRKALGGPSV